LGCRSSTRGWRDGGSEGRRLAVREEIDRWMEERCEGWSVG
jgi:hypothetical protein